jgi:hypothetical protein
MTRTLNEQSGVPGSAADDFDVERFLAFVDMTYRDRVADTNGLAPRQGC